MQLTPATERDLPLTSRFIRELAGNARQLAHQGHRDRATPSERACWTGGRGRGGHRARRTTRPQDSRFTSSPSRRFSRSRGSISRNISTSGPRGGNRRHRARAARAPGADRGRARLRAHGVERVLNWNELALGVYRGHRRDADDRVDGMQRLTGTALTALAATAPAVPGSVRPLTGSRRSRRDLRQRLEHEPAFPQARVRHHQAAVRSSTDSPHSSRSRSSVRAAPARDARLPRACSIAEQRVEQRTRAERRSTADRPPR